MVLEDIKVKELSFRVGRVVKNEAANGGWLHLISAEYILFEYIEVVYEDGFRKYFYEDSSKYEHFERNFVSNRFTSYHEFFTTSEPAVEDRGFIKLNYYVRHDSDSYEKVSLKELLNDLEKKEKDGLIKRVKDRITVYGQYDITVNDHWDE